MGIQADFLNQEVASVVGPLWAPRDLLADRMDMPVSQEGDLVVVFQSGPYGASASSHGLKGQPGGVEVLV